VGALVLAGECVQLAEGELAFAPIVAALRLVIEDAQLLAGLEPALREAVAALWPVAGSTVPRNAGREQLFEAVYRLLARVAQRQPVVLIVEPSPNRSPTGGTPAHSASVERAESSFHMASSCGRASSFCSASHSRLRRLTDSWSENK
jgi:hypothetical protein